MTDATLRQAAEVLRMYLAGDVSHATAQTRLRWSGYRLDDPALAAELQRQDAEQQAAAEAAEVKRRQQDAKLNAYLRRERERTRGITIDGF